MKVRSRGKLLWLAGFLSLAVFVAGCHKKATATAPAAAPEPVAAQPTVTINATPSTVDAGGTVTLAWSSTNATDLTIDPSVGKVAPQGSTPVNPAASTTYTITANGSGGSATASARVTVGAATPTATAPPSGPANIGQLFAQNVQDVYFELDKSDLRDDARRILTKDAEFLRSYPQVRLSLEGHCDERGSTEYNLALGQRRAEAAKNFLISLGISADRVTTTSWGKEKPFCEDHNEACWTQNRRDHFVLQQ